MEFWCLANGTWITWTQIRQINNPQSTGRWCLCLHNLNKTVLHMWPIKWDEIKCYWQRVVMTEQEGKKLNFDCIGTKLAPAEKKAGCLFVTKMAALLPVELEPVLSLQRKKSLQGWQGFNWDGFGLWVLMRLPMKCQSRGVFSAANPYLLRIGPGTGALAQLFGGKARPEPLSSFSLEFSMTFSLQAVQGEETKALRWLIQRKRFLKSESFRACSYCTVSVLYFPPRHFCKHVVRIKIK